MPHAGYFCRRLSKRCVAVSARKVDLQCRGLHEHSFELRTVDPMTGEAKSGFTFDIELLSGMWWIKSIRCLLALFLKMPATASDSGRIACRRLACESMGRTTACLARAQPIGRDQQRCAGSLRGARPCFT